MEFLELLKTGRPVLLDGGMGTMLQARGLPVGAAPETAALEHPEWLREIHSAYLDAGSQIVYANTFGANREKLAHCGRTVAEVVPAAVAAAREAARGRGLVALDVGPIGQLLEPTGTLEFEQAVDIFAEVVEAGAAAGADLIAIETMTDLQEARAALLAAKENSSLPVIVTMTYEERGRTFLGCDPASAALTLEGMGADAIGVNCSLGPREMPPLVRELTRWSTLPIAIKPNAGLPDPGGAGYDITAEEFAGSMAELTGLGVKLYGGCCGTTPEYIALLREKLAGRTIVQVPRQVPAAVCSGTRTVPIDRVRVIGERINPTGKKLMKEALRRGDVDYMLNQALAQTEAGADILDVNVGLPEIDEAEMMVRTVKALQGVTDAPLQLDSTDPRVLEGALRVYCGKAIVNSVNGDEETLNAILPLVKKYGAAVVGLTLDHTGIPKTVDARLSVARRILDRALSYGIRREDVYIDCLTLTVSAEQEAAAQTLEGLRRVKGELGLKTVLGVSNISFGLPARPLINQNFLTMAMAAGLDLPILNPNVDAMMAAVRCYHLLMNIDTAARERHRLHLYYQRGRDDRRPRSGGKAGPGGDRGGRPEGGGGGGHPGPAGESGPPGRGGQRPHPCPGPSRGGLRGGKGVPAPADPVCRGGPGRLRGHPGAPVRPAGPEGGPGDHRAGYRERGHPRHRQEHRQGAAGKLRLHRGGPGEGRGPSRRGGGGAEAPGPSGGAVRPDDHHPEEHGGHHRPAPSGGPAL